MYIIDLYRHGQLVRSFPPLPSLKRVRRAIDLWLARGYSAKLRTL